MSVQREPVMEHFGGYFLLDKIAEGGMAELFRARPADPEANGRIVVIKRILPHIAGDTSFVNMFKAEIRVCMGFSHPNTIRIHDFGNVDGIPFIAMEYVEGFSLSELIQKTHRAGRPLPVATALAITVLASAGLEYVHGFTNQATGTALGIIHRDISPQNILISHEGQVKLIDFGIAKACVGVPEKTMAGQLKGKVSYFSPEQAAGIPLDARSDIFSLGIVLWELLAGKRLFFRTDQNTLNVLESIRSRDIPIKPPSWFNPAIPTRLDALVMHALERDRDQRIQTAGELKTRLSRILRESEKNSLDQHLSTFIHSISGTAIQEERTWIRTLNQQAQTRLTGESTEGQNVAYFPSASRHPRVSEYLRSQPGQPAPLPASADRIRRRVFAGAAALLFASASAFAVNSEGTLLKRISRHLSGLLRRTEPAQPIRFAITEAPGTNLTADASPLKPAVIHPETAPTGKSAKARKDRNPAAASATKKKSERKVRSEAHQQRKERRERRELKNSRELKRQAFRERRGDRRLRRR